MTFRVLDLFSGIGGFSLGLETAGGFTTVAFCEIEQYPRSVLANRWPGVPCYHDIRELTAERLAADGIVPDVLCGGFPCQDISNKGSRTGLAGERSGLWREYARLIRELRPRYAIVENVSAIAYRGLGQVLTDLAQIRYDAEWEIFQARALGANHERERAWVIAYPEGQPGLYESNAWQATKRLPYDCSAWETGSWDEATPKVCGIHDGIPDRVDRTAALGNAVIPQITEMLGRVILAAQTT